MNKKSVMFVVLGVLFMLIVGSSIYIDFIAKTTKGFDYIIICQMILGISAVLTTLFMGLSLFPKKKNYELLLIAFLESIFVLGVIVLNYVIGYRNLVDVSNYVDHMGYISMEFNIILYFILVMIIGLLDLNLFIMDKLSLLKMDNKKA